MIPNRTGFRKGQSCVDNLTNLTLYIEEGYKQKEDTVIAFLDVQSAFDNVISELLLNKLAEMGCSKNIIMFVKFFAYKREIFTSTTKEKRYVFKGVPQGGVLSPLLYTIYESHIINNIPKNIYVYPSLQTISVYTQNTGT